MEDEVKWEDFHLDADHGTKMQIKDLGDDNDIASAILQAIENAEREAFLRGIEANTIVLNKDLAFVKNFYYAVFGGIISEVPPMILGKMPVLYSLPLDYDFAILRSPQNPGYYKQRAEYLEQILQKYVRTDGNSLRFKNLSYCVCLKYF